MVEQPEVFRYGTVYKRAEQLRQHVERAKKEFKAEKVNIIGHSMGGLDARYLITHLGGHEHVASLVTIGSPHRGSSHCDWCIKNIADPLRADKWLHEVLPWEVGAWWNLTRPFLQDEFNPKTPDMEGVRYYSVAGDAKPSIYNPLYLPYLNTAKFEGANDGLVSVESAKWGTFLGTVPLDHGEQIGWSLVVDARPLFRKIINVISEEGH
eukprot:TRINITY_DN1325_c0_g1_i1.p1 TRINITY_DN1325_c0_g1~~TRINITY_DN1325_c0_g1_i1.p1  ORF type:complete len:209 (-),score=24.79 TRINITY_DN1325_c0_g1_i1:12-638(-)